jgi:RNA polymerase sigma-70 factor (ECF subfamily)
MVRTSMKGSLSFPMPLASAPHAAAAARAAPEAYRGEPFAPTTCSLETIFVEHADFVFRTCRWLGLDAAAAEDATQQVFMVAAQKISQIPATKERAFLLLAARNIVANARRAQVRRREDFTEVERADDRHGPDDLLDRARARAVMDRALEDLDFELRTAFVLFEVEELSFTEIAELLAIPRGTVASRVRRAREDLEARLGRALGSAVRCGLERVR